MFYAVFTLAIAIAMQKEREEDEIVIAMDLLYVCIEILGWFLLIFSHKTIL